ncbi:hypothetical protein ERJ75_000993200 [Trypanosoma vivax]|uniref:Uncharacterized protein n=1 Tax=Trypanosoma vivax (strain Y486) TaxID=1055687 RepID=G0UAN8_TRYVY|nr:hypothetical protein ERJ75_000993200 [Trypanosoma vivax]CCC52873.1 conserved hypothetical protein [Trypanosoma vivax Y486]
MHVWTQRNALPLAALCEEGSSAVAATAPTGGNAQACMRSDNEGHKGTDAITALDYALIPQVTSEEAVTILSWVLRMNDVLSQVGVEGVAAFRQVEYFFTGHTNGEVFVFPLVPPLMRTIISRWRMEKDTVESDVPAPWNAGPRRLIHQHSATTEVTSICTLGTLVASASNDAHIHVSLFHPVIQHVLTIQQSSPVACILLWDGRSLVSRVQEPSRRAALAEAEAPIVYIISGDAAGLVRIWRANVEDKMHFLVVVLLIAAPSDCVGFASPLHRLEREDGYNIQWGRQLNAVATRESKAIHALAIDGDKRLVAGVEGGLVVWSLANLPCKQKENDHLLCWDEERLEMETRSTTMLRVRGDRLVNMSVWVKSAALLQDALRRRGEQCVMFKDNRGSAGSVANFQFSTWKPKYGSHVANGAAVGVVSNIVSLPSSSYMESGDTGDPISAQSLLRASGVSLVFPSLRNVVHFPLWAVEPVFAPMCIAQTKGSTCMSLLVLQQGSRILTGGSDGTVILWIWVDGECGGMYTKLLCSNQVNSHTGVCRDLCLLREPDIFLSCGYNDGIVREWHVYDEPAQLLRCERIFTLYPVREHAHSGQTSSERCLEPRGISCAVSFPAFFALFLVGVRESTIRAFGLVEVHGCALPPGYVFDGFKTVQVSTSVPLSRQSTNSSSCMTGT